MHHRQLSVSPPHLLSITVFSLPLFDEAPAGRVGVSLLLLEPHTLPETPPSPCLKFAAQRLSWSVVDAVQRPVVGVRLLYD